MSLLILEKSVINTIKDNDAPILLSEIFRRASSNGFTKAEVNKLLNDHDFSQVIGKKSEVLNRFVGRDGKVWLEFVRGDE